ncbi:MAG: quinone oxidoreductase [Rhodospirillales bacterium]|nr:MAG: quinone oxidoreductase [Rhodospirillales bacterium]
MTEAVRIHAHGGPEELVFEAVTVPEPMSGQVRLRQTAIGLNFIDVYHRTGLYPVPALPAILGMEAAGVVEAVGPDVSGLAPGDRVAYAGILGAYTRHRVIAADRLVHLSPSISDEVAAAMMLKGMTAQYLLRRTYRVQAGDPILVHAAAGGVGLLLCQWARHLGATVIGTVGTEAKADLARANGCHHPIVYTRESFVDRVRDLTGGEGVAVVYDSVGKDTFDESLDCLRPLGMMVTFGNASGPVPPVEPARLSAKGSLFLTRPTLMTYIAKPSDLQATARELLDVVTTGHVRILVGATYRLAETPQAHRDLENRLTTGSTVLLP